MSGVRTDRDARRLLHSLHRIGAPVPSWSDFARAVQLDARQRAERKGAA